MFSYDFGAERFGASEQADHRPVVTRGRDLWIGHPRLVHAPRGQPVLGLVEHRGPVHELPEVVGGVGRLRRPPTGGGRDGQRERRGRHAHDGESRHRLSSRQETGVPGIRYPRCCEDYFTLK